MAQNSLSAFVFEMVVLAAISISLGFLIRYGIVRRPIRGGLGLFGWSMAILSVLILLTEVFQPPAIASTMGTWLGDDYGPLCGILAGCAVFITLPWGTKNQAKDGTELQQADPSDMPD